MSGKIARSAGVLLVRDVVTAANYYRDQLGFAYDRLWNDPPNFVILKRDQHFVMLAQPDDPAKVVPHAIYQEMQARGAIIDYSLYLTPYGIKEFGVHDLDGHDIAFGEPVD